MADQGIRGRFVWHELMTPDAAGAQSFYTKALGWTTQAWEQDPSYQMFAAVSGPLGGVFTDPNMAPQWLTYIGVDDVPAAAERVKSLGGKITKGPENLPSGGSYAVAVDPQGATFGLYGSSASHAKEQPPKQGEFSWHELATSDYRAAFQFYSQLFGWEKIVEHDMGPLGVYFIFGADGVQKGGMFNKPAAMKGPPSWLGYVRVKDVNKTAAKVKAGRGTLINGPMEVPGGDWIAQFIDPYGAMFAVHTVASDVKKAAPAAAAPREESATLAPSSEPVKAKAPAKKVAKPAARKAAPKPAAKKAPARKKAASKKKAAGKKKAAKRSSRKGGARKSAARATKRGARKAAGKAKRGGKKKAARKK